MPHSRTLPSRRRQRFAVAVVALLMLTAGCTSDKEPTGTSQDNQTTVESPDAHAEGWARLVWAAQKFRAAAEAEPKKRNPYQFGDTPEQVIRTLKFQSPTAVLSDYQIEQDTLRYCFTNRQREFYATEVTEVFSRKPKTSVAIGLGDCDYTKGATFIGTDGGVAGQPVLDKIETAYQGLLDGSISEHGPLTESLDGKRNLVPNVAVYTADILVTREKALGVESVDITAKLLKKADVKYPKGIKFAWFDGRGKEGYRFCVTDGNEEAVYENSPERSQVVRFAAGNCFAQ